MIKNLDDEIGRLLDYLDKNELSDNTLVFLISDNGGAEYNLTTRNGMYQGGKITNFEGGVKVPMLMRWPGHIPSGIDYDYPVHATDMFVTTVAAGAGVLPDDRIYDGTDLTQVLTEGIPAHEYIYIKMGFNGGIRNLEWKLTWNEDNGDSILFHLDNDPYEQHNLYHQGHPAVEPLVDAFNKWAENNKSPSWPPVMHYYYTADDGSEHYFDQ
jgi:arylsulfatase A-like enzyme